MKYIRCLLFTLFLASGLCAFASAEDVTTWDLAPAGVTIDLPSDLSVLTRETKDGDPVLSTFGLTSAEVSDLFSRNGWYLSACPEDVAYELIVGISPPAPCDVAALTPEQMEAFIRNAFGNGSGVEFLSGDFYDTPDGRSGYAFLVSAAQDGYTTYVRRYIIYEKDRSVTIQLNSYHGVPSAEMERIVRAAADSAVITPMPPFPPAQERAVSEYANEANGVRLSLPEGWYETTHVQGPIGEHFYAAFGPMADASGVLLCGRVDVWSEMTEEEKRGLTRETCDNSAFTAEEIGEICGDQGSVTVETIRVDGAAYFQAELDQPLQIGDVSFTATVTALLRVENGWCHIFMFVGSPESIYYDDFCFIADSAFDHLPVKSAPEEAPGASSGAQPELPVPERPAPAGSGPVSPLAVLGFLLAVPAAILLSAVWNCLPIILYRFAIRRAPVARAKAIKIAVIYAACIGILELIVHSVLDGGAPTNLSVAIWCFVNYLILRSGAKRAAAPAACPAAPGMTGTNAAAPQQAPRQMPPQEPPQVPQMPQRGGDEAEAPPLYCTKCGARLKDGASFCAKCGAPAGR